MRFSGFTRFLLAALSVLVILSAAGGIIAGAWYEARQTVEAQRTDAIQRTEATVAGLAATYAEQIGRQIQALDQTLDTMAQVYEADPRHFNLSVERDRARMLNGLARDIFVTDENGIIRESTVSDFIGKSVANLDAFHDAAEHANDRTGLFLGGASVSPIMRQWHLDALRVLHHPDGSFAGIIDTDYRLSAITEVLAAGAPPGNSFAAVINLSEGKLRAGYGGNAGLAAGTPDANIADSPMFGAIDAGGLSGQWFGPSATDTVKRFHAFRRLPGRDLAIIVGIDEQDVFARVTAWQWQARLFAGAITGLAVVVAALLLVLLGAGRRRAARERETRAQLASASALADVSRAQTEATQRRLAGTLAAVTDGIAIFDAHLNLVEWNRLFAEHAGINASFIRVGTPMEAVLRIQAEDGCFGVAADIDAEVERRAALLRAGNFGESQAFQVRDRAIELRCLPLAEGGFVALYADVTELRRARQALRDAHVMLTRERAGRTRFLGVIAYELRARVAVLTHALRELGGPSPSPDAIERTRRVGESLAGLATQAVEVPVMEASGVTLSPALVTVRPLLAEAVEAVRPAAQLRGITIYPAIDPSTPAELTTDPARLRQIVTLLLTEAVRLAAPDTMWLLADGGDGEDASDHGMRIIVRGFGARLSERDRDAVFPPLDAVAPPTADAVGGREPGTGLGPAIVRYLVSRMGGTVRCEPWSTPDGRTGNDLLLSLPPDVLLGRRGRAPGQIPADGRKAPRTRVLLAGTPTGQRMAAATMLRRDNHHVDIAAGGELALRALGAVPYDIVFADATQPDMTIVTLAERMRDIPGPQRTMPFIVLAPPPDDTDARMWRHAGVTAVLPAEPTLDHFTAAILAHVWHGGPSGGFGGIMPGMTMETEAGIPILDAARVGELRANIGSEELSRLAEECISDLHHRLPALRRSLAAGASGAVAAHSQAMVGMAGGYGMAVLEARLRAILAAVRERRLHTIDGAAAMVESDLTRAAEALRRALRAPMPTASGLRN